MMSKRSMVVAAAAATLVLSVVSVAANAAPARPQQSRAASADRGKVLPYFDIRAAGPAAAPMSATARGARAKLVNGLGTGARLQLDRSTGTVRSLQRLDGALTASASGDRATIAWSYVKQHAGALGLDGTDLAGFHLAQERRTPASGLVTLRWSQSYRGIPAFDNDLRVSVDRTGRVLTVIGAPVHGLALRSTVPSISASDAVRAVAVNVGSNRAVKATSGPTGTRRETHFGSVDMARLVIFGGYGAPRLAWHVIYMARTDAVYDAVVDANTGQVLYRGDLTKSDSDVSVFKNYPGAPAGGTQTPEDLSAPTAGSPSGYLNTGATSLVGPNAHAWSDVNDDNVPNPNEEVHPSSGTNFVYPFTDFSAQAVDGGCTPTALCSWNGDVDNQENFVDPTSWHTNRKQNAAQAFWYVNNFHDHLASAPIGFRSPDNFQDDDPVLVQADDGASTGPDGGPDFNHRDNANMNTFPVGTSPIMQMYLFNDDPFFAPFRSVNGGDAGMVVYHEYTHGLSNRLITNDDGTGALNSPQSGAMGEAWSDWYAMDYLVRQRLIHDDPNVAGEVDLGLYTDAVPNVIRTQPMDCPVGLQNSDTCFGALTGSPGGYTYGEFGHILGSPEVHGDGEIWGETLWDLRSALIEFEGSNRTGSDDAEMIITDGMRLSLPQPSMLDERNAILAAIQADFGGSRRAAIVNLAWNVFRHRGMGYYAGAADGNDTNPIEDFAPPPVPGGPTGSIAGTVTSADTGLPSPGLTVAIGGDGDPNAFGRTLAAVTDANGHFRIANVPTGTYGELVVYTAPGFDQVRDPAVQVKEGRTTTRNLTTRRDWAASRGGAHVQVSDNSFAGIGCGGAQLIDQTQGAGWSPFNPHSQRPDNPHAGTPTAVIKLPRAITVRAFLADPGNTCGDDLSSSTKGYRIETSPDGTTWTVASSGTFTAADAHRLNVLSPAAPIEHVRYVRLMSLGVLSECGTCSGADFQDFSELEVLGATPNVLPSGTLHVSPATVTAGEPATFTARFHDPDSAITGYSWDFNGDGTIDRTTSKATTTLTYTHTGSFAATVTANDFKGGGTTATANVMVRPPKPPHIVVPSTGSAGGVPITFTCVAACELRARATVTGAVRHRYGLPTTVGHVDAALLQAGTKTVTLKLDPAVLTTLRDQNVDNLPVTVDVRAHDTNGQSTAIGRGVTIAL